MDNAIPKLHLARDKAVYAVSLAIAIAATAAWAAFSPSSFIGFALGLAAGCYKSKIKDWLEEG
jgi:ABC-type dipeptide/oligopeptide/nickel transport system permease subunit